jgi:hypothetical protein
MKTYIIKYSDGKDCHVKEVTGFDKQSAISQLFAAKEIYWCRTREEQEEIETSIFK